MAITGPLLLVGCGKMGHALLGGWLAGGMAADAVTVIEPHPVALDSMIAQGVRLTGAVQDLPSGYAPAIVVFAIKPQMMDAALPAFSVLTGPQTVFLSIAAGKNIAYFERILGTDAAIVRAMPNTPAAVGRGMSVLVANGNASQGQQTVCGELMAAAGEVAWVEDEALLDPVTAVSGGGPAYVFLLIECLAQAGVDAGLPEDLALRLARVTVAGSGELVHQSDAPAATLRENVTSPGGTTLEALKVLMAEDGLQPLMSRAIAEATRRSRELGD